MTVHLSSSDVIASNHTIFSEVEKQLSLSKDKILEYILLFNSTIIYCPYLNDIKEGYVLVELILEDDTYYFQYINHLCSIGFPSVALGVNVIADRKLEDKITKAMKKNKKFNVLLPVKAELNNSRIPYLAFELTSEALNAIKAAPEFAVNQAKIDCIAGYAGIQIKANIIGLVNAAKEDMIQGLLNLNIDKPHTLNIVKLPVNINNLLLSRDTVELLHLLEVMPTNILEELLKYRSNVTAIRNDIKLGLRKSWDAAEHNIQYLTEKLVKNQDNYVETIPTQITYPELIERWKKSGLVADEIRNAVLENGLVMYYCPEYKVIFTEPDLSKGASPDEPILISVNGSNVIAPKEKVEFVKRYGNLQRFSLAILKELFENKNGVYESYFTIKGGVKHYLDRVEGLSTTKERWLGISEYNPKITMLRIDEFRFFLKDVEEYERKYQLSEQNSSLPLCPKSNNRGSVFRKIVIYTISKLKLRSANVDNMELIWNHIVSNDLFCGEVSINEKGDIISYKTNHGKEDEGFNKPVKKKTFIGTGTSYFKFLEEYVQNPKLFDDKYKQELTNIQRRLTSTQ